jgi:RNA-directed DNA polymerase
MADLAALDAGGGVAHGPEDLINWEALDWRHQSAQVQRLRQRIFKAAQAGDHKQVRNLPKLMLRSRANTLVSVLQASQRNTGRHTAGVDGQLALTSTKRSDLAMLLHRRVGPSHALPVRRVYPPKKAGNAHSGFPLSLTAPSNNGCVTHWNPNGRHGWIPSNTGSGRAVDAMTRSR